MISLLTGKIITNNTEAVTLLTTGGVGYAIKVSPAAAIKCQVGSETALETYLVVREDALELYGFATNAERELFKQCLSVSGVGPRTALHLLALGSVEEITIAIGRGDVDYLTKVSGIGKKTAERVIVELRSKVKGERLKAGEAFDDASGTAIGDVIDALVALDYSVMQAREVVKKLDAKGKNSEQLLREALRSIK